MLVIILGGVGSLQGTFIPLLPLNQHPAPCHGVVYLGELGFRLVRATVGRML